MLNDEKAFLPRRFVVKLNRGRAPSDMPSHQRGRAVLDRLILSLGDQQLVTGLAILVAGYVKERNIDNIMSAHFELIVYMSCLSSSSHLACLITLRKYLEEHRFTSVLRVCVVLCFAVFLIGTIAIIQPTFYLFYVPLEYTLFYPLNLLPYGPFTQAIQIISSISPIIWLFFTALVELTPGANQWTSDVVRNRIWRFCRRWLGLGYLWKVLQKLLPSRWRPKVRGMITKTFWYLMLLTPCTIFVLQICFALISMVMALLQKFLRVPANEGLCDLRTSNEDTWGFGQLLPMLLLWLPLLSAVEAYNGNLPNEKSRQAPN